MDEAQVGTGAHLLPNFLLERAAVQVLLHKDTAEVTHHILTEDTQADTGSAGQARPDERSELKCEPSYT